MANSTSAICFLVVVMAIIVCLSMLVGLQGFTRQGDDQLLREAEMYANAYTEGFEDDPDADLDEPNLEDEPVELEVDMDDENEGEPEEFQSRPVTDLTDPRTTNRVPVVREEIIPFDGTDMQTFGSVAL